MTKGIPVDSATKAEVIKAIREEGMTIAQASQVFGLGKSTISHWLSEKTCGSEKNTSLKSIS